MKRTVFYNFEILLRKQFLKKLFIKLLNDKYIQAEIIDTITARLYDKGKDSDGRKLETDYADLQSVYAKSTKAIKKDKGQKFDVVTLKDSGEFYSSFWSAVRGTSLFIDAFFNKDDGHIYENFTQMFDNETEFENKIAQLTKHEKDTIIKEFLKPEFADLFKKELQNIVILSKA